MIQFVPILETYLTHYKKDRQGFTDMIGNLDVPRQVISALYETFVHRKELEPIESLSIEENRELWNTSKTYTTDPKTAVMIAKSLYLMEKIVQPE